MPGFLADVLALVAFNSVRAPAGQVTIRVFGDRVIAGKLIS